MIPDLADVTVIGPVASEIFSWKRTSVVGNDAHVTQTTQVCPHSKAGKWPIFDIGTAAEGNMWVICQRDGRWYASTLHWLRPGQQEKEDDLRVWGKDQIRTAPLDYTWAGPVYGDLIGMFMSTAARFEHRTINERSDIVWIKVGEPGIVAREGDPGEPEPPEPEPPPVDPSDLEARVARLEALLSDMAELIQESLAR